MEFSPSCRICLFLSLLSLLLVSPSTSKSVSDPLVAFHADLRGGTAITSYERTLVFPRVITNIGGAYNRHTGEFIAPRRGTYEFSFTVRAHNSNGFAHLMKNLEIIASSYHDNHEHGTNTVILQLNAGDRVWVKITANADIARTTQSTFTGKSIS